MNKKSEIRNLQSLPDSIWQAGAIRNGFTLMELMVVIAIIALLAGIMTPNVARRLERAKMTKVEADIAAIETAIAMYENDLGYYPFSIGLNGIDCLETCLTGRDSLNAYDPKLNSKWSGPYIKGIDKDPWGQKYVYLKNTCPRVPSTCPGTLSTCPSCYAGWTAGVDYPNNNEGGSVNAPLNMSYYIYSKGKNKNTGTAALAVDDINNWDVNKSWQSEY